MDQQRVNIHTAANYKSCHGRIRSDIRDIGDVIEDPARLDVWMNEGDTSESVFQQNWEIPLVRRIATKTVVPIKRVNFDTQMEWQPDFSLRTDDQTIREAAQVAASAVYKNVV